MALRSAEEARSEARRAVAVAAARHEEAVAMERQQTVAAQAEAQRLQREVAELRGELERQVSSMPEGVAGLVIGEGSEAIAAPEDARAALAAAEAAAAAAAVSEAAARAEIAKLANQLAAQGEALEQAEGLARHSALELETAKETAQEALRKQAEALNEVKAAAAEAQAAAAAEAEAREEEVARTQAALAAQLERQKVAAVDGERAGVQQVSAAATATVMISVHGHSDGYRCPSFTASPHTFATR